MVWCRTTSRCADTTWVSKLLEAYPYIELSWAECRSPHERCLCIVKIKTETGYGVVLCLTGLSIVTKMIPGDFFGCVSSVLQWGKTPRVHLTIINGGIFSLHVPVSTLKSISKSFSLELVCGQLGFLDVTQVHGQFSVMELSASGIVILL